MRGNVFFGDYMALHKGNMLHHNMAQYFDGNISYPNKCPPA